MARPKPNVLIEHTDKSTYKITQILEADAVWAVFYNNTAFNLKNCNALTSHPGPKYKKTSFSNPGHAHNLAEKLNTLFNTSAFNVVKLSNGGIVYDTK
jgi:hypothetical protein